MTTTLWLTGLSGAGKSTLAEAAATALQAQGRACTVLDGDVLRRGLCRDLGYSAADRQENQRRIAEVARLLNQAGLVVIVAVIAPSAADRAMARDIIGTAWREVHVATPLTVCEQRDPKGLYRRARAGELAQFTGVSAGYDVPLAPDLRLDTSHGTLAEHLDQLLQLLTVKDTR